MSGRPVIASVDGSDKAARAIAVAAALAKFLDADLCVLRVMDVPSNRLLAHAKAIGLDHSAVTGLREVEAQLADAVAGVRVGPGHRITVDVLEARDVADAIIEQAAHRDAHALVIATRAPGAVGRALTGSVGDRVMRESPRPVVLVPPRADSLGGKNVQIARVLVPQDSSSLAFRCLEFLIDLPNARDLEYVLLEVVATESARPLADATLAASAAWLRSRGAKSVEVLVGVSTDPAAAIIGAVREVLPDFIAMSTRGASGLGRLFLGSVASGVVRRSELPVLLLTPRMLHAAAGVAAQPARQLPETAVDTFDDVDDTSQNSFPASDPPGWNTLRIGPPRERSS
jgi:nucleotide-binding universal stress UspA family protein